MVKAITRFLLAGVALSLISDLSAKDLLDYQIGDKVESDIVAPVELTVVDAEATEALKQKEAYKVPVVIRVYTNVADEVIQSFQEAFLQTRTNFLEAVEKTFSQRKLSPWDLSSGAFQELAVLFQTQNQLFPVSLARATLWAGGTDDQPYLDSLNTALRRAMQLRVRADAWPEGIKIGAVVRLVPIVDADETLTASVAAQRGSNAPKNKLIPLTTAKINLQNYFPPEEQPASHYVASFLKVNCVVDEDVTRELQTQRTENILVADHYATGEILAKRGQAIDKKSKAALEQLKEKAALGGLQQLVALMNDPTKASDNRKPAPWLVGGLVTAVLVLVLAVWQLTRLRQPVMVLPVPMVNRDLANVSEKSWQARALTAEQRAGKTQSQLRDGVMSQVARWLSDHGVRGLISQRARLLAAQQIAINEMAELEARLEKIQAPLQDRLEEYQRRVWDLEKKLAMKGDENRELIQAKLEVVRKQLDHKRGGHQLTVNPGQPDAWELRLKIGSNSFGRGPTNDFQIDNSSVSVCHCEIIVTYTDVMIKDLDSTNGTRVNGHIVRAATLQSGQRIHVGSVEMLFTAAALVPVAGPELAVTQPLIFSESSLRRTSQN
jgi:hypothetical protein